MALEMRAACERCGGALDPAGEAYVCSFECTFCRACHAELRGVCPNCGGELLTRPRRGPKAEPRAVRADAGSLAVTTPAPYYLVAFTSLRTDVDDGYGATSARMVELAAQQPGYLGIESARGQDGLGITLSYWRSQDDLRAWKAVAEHRQAQQRGRSEWYSHYRTRVGRVDYDYGFEAPPRS
jgi:heme-degrading monooxygenase HmoA